MGQMVLIRITLLMFYRYGKAPQCSPGVCLFAVFCVQSGMWENAYSLAKAVLEYIDQYNVPALQALCYFLFTGMPFAAGVQSTLRRGK